MLNFQLTDHEFNSLAEKYAVEGQFNHSAFCHTINTAFTKKGIDKDPVASVKPVTKDDTVAARRKYLEASSEEEALVQAFI